MDLNKQNCIQPSSKDVLTNTQNCRWTHAMILVEFFQKVTHLKSFFQVVVLQEIDQLS